MFLINIVVQIEVDLMAVRIGVVHRAVRIVMVVRIEAVHIEAVRIEAVRIEAVRIEADYRAVHIEAAAHKVN